MLIIPAIDLRDGRCVRLRQGRRDEVTKYDGDPVEVAKTFQTQGAEWLHVVDLDGAFAESNSRNRETLKAISEAVSIPVQFGGGLRSFASVEQAFALGAGRLVIGTLAVESPKTLGALLDSFGPEKIVVGIDAKGGQAVIRGWEEAGSIAAIGLARAVADLGVERIIYTDVARDGMLQGPNVEAPCTIARACGLQVTASGGIGSLDDIRRIKAVSECGIDSVIVGRAIYD